MKFSLRSRTPLALAIGIVAAHGLSCFQETGAPGDGAVDSTKAPEPRPDDPRLTGLYIAQADRYDYYGDYEVAEEDVLRAGRLLNLARKRYSASADARIEEALSVICEARRYWPNITRLYALEMLIEGPEDRMLPPFDTPEDSSPGSEILAAARAIFAGLEDEHLRLH